MASNHQGIETTEKKKKDCFEILVESEKYNNDEHYSKHINDTLMGVFKSIGSSY